MQVLQKDVDSITLVCDMALKYGGMKDQLVETQGVVNNVMGFLNKLILEANQNVPPAKNGKIVGPKTEPVKPAKVKK